MWIFNLLNNLISEVLKILTIAPEVLNAKIRIIVRVGIHLNVLITIILRVLMFFCFFKHVKHMNFAVSLSNLRIVNVVVTVNDLKCLSIMNLVII